MNDFGIIWMKFGNEFWLILFREYISPKLFAVHFKVNWKAKIYIYGNSTIQRCPNKIIKIFCLKIFSICHRCRWHRWCTLSREYLREFSKKFEKTVLVHSYAWGKLIHEKNQKSKISWHFHFKLVLAQAYTCLRHKRFIGLVCGRARWKSIRPKIYHVCGSK
jgi:hypothetical protein